MAYDTNIANPIKVCTFRSKKTDDIFDIIAGYFKPLAELASRETELSAIWLERSVLLPNGIRTARITKDMNITIENGGIVDSTLFRRATHRIVGCLGTLSNSTLSIGVEDLVTKEFSIIKLK